MPAYWPLGSSALPFLLRTNKTCLSSTAGHDQSLSLYLLLSLIYNSFIRRFHLNHICPQSSHSVSPIFATRKPNSPGARYAYVLPSRYEKKATKTAGVLKLKLRNLFYREKQWEYCGESTVDNWRRLHWKRKAVAFIRAPTPAIRSNY